MIGFLQPLALIGLVAVALPPLLHLIGRRLPPTVVFPAVRYLTATEREHSRRLKLRNLLLLLLRMAVILLVVLAAARPVARVASGTGHPPTAMALVLDNSLSSGAVVGGRRVLDVLAERAQHVLERATEQDQIWIVLADGLPRRVGRAEALALADSVTPWSVRLDVSEAVRIAARAVEEAPLPVREVVVLSDLQETALSAGEPSAVPVLLWDSPEVPENRGIDSAHVEPRVWSQSGEVIVRLGGAFGEEAALRLEADGRELAGAVAGSGEVVVLSATAAERGWLPARLTLDPDELNADDQWFLALRVADPAATRVERGVGSFVREAADVLLQGGRIRSGAEVTLADQPVAGTTVLFPPEDPALVGAVNRALAARGVEWRLGELVEGEWVVTGDAGAARGAPVLRRYRLLGSGPVVARAGGEPWLVRAGDLVIVASRMEVEWTGLPVSAGFVPFIDLLVNRLAAGESWVLGATPGQTVRLPAAARSVLVAGAEIAAHGGAVAVPLDPGVYFLRGAAGDTVGALEVNHDRRESRLAPAAPTAVRATLGPEASVLGDRAMDRELFQGARRADLTAILLAAAIAAALLEFALASVGGAARRG